MRKMNVETGHPPRSETETERQARIAWEAARIAEARASVAAGRVVSSERVDAWIDSLGTDHELPVPRSGQGGMSRPAHAEEARLHRRRSRRP